MKMSFLEYAKVILMKVSFDQWLMLKEYGKLYKLLDEQEKTELDVWLEKNKKSNRFFPLSPIQCNKSGIK